MTVTSSLQSAGAIAVPPEPSPGKAASMPSPGGGDRIQRGAEAAGAVVLTVAALASGAGEAAAGALCLRAAGTALARGVAGGAAKAFASGAKAEAGEIAGSVGEALTDPKALGASAVHHVADYLTETVRSRTIETAASAAFGAVFGDSIKHVASNAYAAIAARFAPRTP